MNTKQLVLTSAITLALVTGCSEDTASTQSKQTETSKNQIATNQSEKPVSQTESEKANALFDKMFMDAVMRSPMYQSYLGIKKDQDKWDEMTEAKAKEELEISKKNLEKINQFDESKLDDQTKVSLILARQQLEDDIKDYKWRHYNYPLNQMFGIHSSVPSLLINQHSISNLDDAEDYIARLNGIPTLFDQVIDGLNIRAEKGIIAPKFVYPHVIRDSKNIITGAPFNDGEDSTLFADFKNKVSQLEIDQQIKDKLISDAKVALVNSVMPAYNTLIDRVKTLADRATTKDGAWKFPEGEAYYNRALQNTTTTDLTAEEIHQIGLDEVARIHDEMRKIMKQVKFDGDLQAFFEYMRTNERFYYNNDKAGRERYLSEATQLIDNMKTRLDELFIVKPKAGLTVKAVEAFREKSAGKAFYQQPSMDGTRPGTYYANLYDMGDMPTYQMEALAYHEGVPGHHMQIAIAQELEGIPKFRKFGRYTAYTEGWGLYSELVPKEIGLYQDPYSDFGRLAMELWRACRLVVDTGIHAMKWDRQQGIDYYVANTPNPKPDAVKMVERHIVMPSQATAYKIGMLKILELREKAKTQMGDQFDIRQFHDVVLKNGPVPLNVLEQFVNDYINTAAPQ
ncbi:DUF885 domain-containing protein [Pleionea mediterranea]|uniref:Uncharacterized protein (DUF885 family) n=1 Tax=Pleionea mediterranea TaxID=523701 RepID=A0A316FPJ5_9GAMM|nr:DUF885 domain-containing protein [Pleionea mediterranea]PWK50052.1 uncharacterized protein (DUF885 family) [Pleionea mediterranea]